MVKLVYKYNNKTRIYEVEDKRVEDIICKYWLYENNIFDPKIKAIMLVFMKKVAEEKGVSIIEVFEKQYSDMILSMFADEAEEYFKMQDYKKGKNSKEFSLTMNEIDLKEILKQAKKGKSKRIKPGDKF